MDRFVLPQGEAAALMPEAGYSIPGLFLYSGLVYQCLDQVEAKCGWRIPVRSLYGSPSFGKYRAPVYVLLKELNALPDKTGRAITEVIGCITYK